MLGELIKIDLFSTESEEEGKEDVESVMRTSGIVIKEGVDFAHVGTSLEINFAELGANCFLVVDEILVVGVGT